MNILKWCFQNFNNNNKGKANSYQFNTDPIVSRAKNVVSSIKWFVDNDKSSDNGAN